MKLNEKVRMLREMSHWSQEDMAEQMKMSKNGYAKLERGESNISLARLEQIATIFNIEISELLDSDNRGMIFVVGDNNNNGDYSNYYGGTVTVALENDQLKMMLAHKEEIIKRQQQEIDALKQLIAALQNKH